MQEPQRSFKIFTNDNALNIYKPKIAQLFKTNQKSVAYSYLVNARIMLKSSKQLEISIILEMFYLQLLAVTECVADLFALFIDDAETLFYDIDLYSNYVHEFNTYLLTEILDLTKILSNHSYEDVIRVYKLANEFYLVKQCNLCNIMTFNIGDLYLDKKNPGYNENEALYAYSTIFMNLLALSLNKSYLPTQSDLEQLLQALQKVCKLITNTDTLECYQLIKTIFEEINSTFDPGFLDKLMPKIFLTKDYHLWKNVDYIFTFLMFVRSKSPEIINPTLATALGDDKFKTSLLKLRDQTSIFKAIDDKDNDKIETLILANISLNFCNPENFLTPLQSTISNGYLEGTRLLVEKAKMNLEEADNRTLPPIYLAINKANDSNRLLILRFLLERGIKTTPYLNYNLPSALYFAFNNAKKEAAELLMEFGCQLTPNEFDVLRKSEKNDSKLLKELFLKHHIYRASFVKCKEDTYDHLSFPLTKESKTSKTPIWCIYAIDGNLISYTRLASRVAAIEEDRPVYGIISPLISSSRNNKETADTVPQKAALIRATVKSRQPLGPYIFFAQSFGGTLCWETARQLLDEGEEVLIFMYDSMAPCFLQQMSEEDYAKHLQDIVSKLVPHIGLEKHQAPDINELKKLNKSDQVEAVLPLSLITDDSKLTVASTIKSNLLSAITYLPESRTESNIIINCFNADSTIKQNGGDESLGWNSQTNQCCFTRIIAGANHFSIITDDKFATEVANCILNHDLVKLADIKRNLYFLLSSILTTVQLSHNISGQNTQMKQRYDKEFIEAAQKVSQYLRNFLVSALLKNEKTRPKVNQILDVRHFGELCDLLECETLNEQQRDDILNAVKFKLAKIIQSEGQLRTLLACKKLNDQQREEILDTFRNKLDTIDKQEVTDAARDTNMTNTTPHVFFRKSSSSTIPQLASSFLTENRISNSGEDMNLPSAGTDMTDDAQLARLCRKG